MRYDVGVDEDKLIALLAGTRRDPIFVGRVSDGVAQAIGAFTTAVWLSPDNVKKQETKRQIADHQLYLRAPLIISGGYVLIEAPRHAIFIHHEGGSRVRSYKAVVKATATGNELYLLSVHRVDRTGVRAAFRRGVRLTEYWKRKGVR